MDITKKTDLELMNDKLQEIKPNITPADKKATGYSPAIIIKYLNGRGTSLATAHKMLSVFKRRIKERRALLNEE